MNKLIILSAFVVAALFGAFTFKVNAQTASPMPSASPTATTVPSAAPSTGFGK